MGAAPPVGAAYRGLVLVVVPPCIRPRVTDFQPFEQLAFEVDTPREALLAAVVDDALRIVVGERRVVRGFLVGARERERVIRVDGRAGDLLDPVGSLAQRERVGVHRAGERRIGADVGMVGVGAERGVVVAVLCEFRRVHDVEVAGQLREADVGLERDVRLARRAESPFGGDEDDAVGAA